jgi:hypothetical protein
MGGAGPLTVGDGASTYRLVRHARLGESLLPGPAGVALYGPGRTLRGVPARSLWHLHGDRRIQRERAAWPW